MFSIYFPIFTCHLKKVLALVLAFACAFTMFAGAASYSDKADIKATTAVDMLSSLGVIQGYEDGSFKPNTTVTRAQMAKMIFTANTQGRLALIQQSSPDFIFLQEVDVNFT